jgi:hypothetical protein
MVFRLLLMINHDLTIHSLGKNEDYSMVTFFVDLTSFESAPILDLGPENNYPLVNYHRP